MFVPQQGFVVVSYPRTGWPTVIYLFSTEVGHHLESLGFPSVETCFAIVLQTDAMLIGWHSFNTLAIETQANAAVFRTYINSVPDHGTSVRLYGATNKKEHGGDWRAELTSIAAQIGYKGPASLINLHQGEGTYVQFDRMPAARTCDVSYKRNSKMIYRKGEVNPDDAPHRRIVKGNPTIQKLYGGDDNTAVIYAHAKVDRDQSKSGRMHSASWSDTTSFTIN